MMPSHVSETFAEEVETSVKNALQAAVDQGEYDLDFLGDGVAEIETYEEALLPVTTRGIQIRFNDGSIALLTIKAARPGG